MMDTLTHTAVLFVAYRCRSTRIVGGFLIARGVIDSQVFDDLAAAVIWVREGRAGMVLRQPDDVVAWRHQR